MPRTRLIHTLASIRRAWRQFKSPGRGIDAINLSPDLPETDTAKLRDLMKQCLEARGGEVSARARAAVLGQAYLNLNEDGRKKYLEILVTEFSVSSDTLSEAKAIIDRGDTNPDQLSSLRELLTPPRVKLLTQFNDLPQGVRFLVDLRADVLSFSKTSPALKSLDYDLKRLLKSWFDIGFLELKRLTWKDPASLLEKLIEYEAVHEISSWEDLRNRLDSDRRCYAFFHPCMPDEPLIFVEVALVKGIANNIQDLLDKHAPTIEQEDADTAIFYSITNTQSGLKGIQFGSFLIKQVVDDLKSDLVRLNTFATLSPVPGLMKYIRKLSAESINDLLTDEQKSDLEQEYGTIDINKLIDSENWNQRLQNNGSLKPVMMKLCAYYLAYAKRDNNRALDPVAEFHLNNGARLENINWMADTSGHGIKQSAGMMVNYVYRLDHIEKNHEQYNESGSVVMSGGVENLLR